MTYTPKPGDRVRIRRYVQPSLTPGDIARELDCDVEGTVTFAAGVIELDPASAHVRYSSDGHDDTAPFGLAWRVGLGYVFLGGSARDGTCRYLVTEVEQLPRDLAGAIGATPPGHNFADRELLNIARLGLSRIYTAPADEASDGMRECARQALARLEGRDRL